MADTPKCPTCRKETIYSMYVYVKTQCHVCFEDKDKMCALRCGHLFCEECCERIGLMKKDDPVVVYVYADAGLPISMMNKIKNTFKHSKVRFITNTHTPNTRYDMIIDNPPYNG